MIDKFYLVCAWDGYYPQGGLDNIVLVTFDLDEANEAQVDYKQRGIPSPYDPDDRVTRYRRDNVKVFSSDELPWSEKDE